MHVCHLCGVNEARYRCPVCGRLICAACSGNGACAACRPLTAPPAGGHPTTNATASQGGGDGPSSDADGVVTASGVNGQVTVYRETVVIKRKGGLAFLTQGLKGDKTIQIRQISSVQFRRAGSITNGYIQFAFQGGLETKGGLFDAVSDENSVMFTSVQQPMFERVKAAVEGRLSEATSATPTAPTSSVADEIAKLAVLLDNELITREEFEHKKRQLLGL